MKTTIAFLAVMFCFGLTASAQQSTLADSKPAMQKQSYSAEDEGYRLAAVKDVVTLSKHIELTNDQKEKLKAVFEQKHRMFSKNMSAERKKTLSESLEAKIKSTLEPAQIQKIEGNEGLMKTLTQ